MSDPPFDVDIEDGIPTQPPVPEASALALAQWVAESDSDAREMEEIVHAYSAMTVEQRVIVRAICREFTKTG